MVARLDTSMAHDASGQVVERLREERGKDDASDVSVAPREPWSWTNWSGPVTVCVLGVVAVGVIVSAITVVSRQPFGTIGVVLPTRPLTTPTAPPPPPTSAAPVLPP